ncbi:MAG: hypothetical protein ABIF17_04435 [Patescibacteria group bacterium]
MQKTAKIFLFIFLFITPITVIAESKTNAGFVNGIWYSKQPFFSNEVVRVYNAFQNQSGFDITATVNFFDNDVLIGSNDISVINGRLTEVWVDYTFKPGNHKISVTVTNAKKNAIGFEPENIEIFNDNLNIDLFIDEDLDKDDVGNLEDDDDDGDGFLDIEEQKLGTDPLDKNSPAPEVIISNKNINSGSISENSEDTENKIIQNKNIFNKIIDLNKKIKQVAEPVTNSLVYYINSKIDNLSEPKISTQSLLENNKKTVWQNLYLILLNILLFIIKNWLVCFLIMLVLLFFKKIFRPRRR